MKIQVKENDNVIIFELNDSKAAKDLYEQLPMIVEVENFNSNEKIFYPAKKLKVEDTPLANAKVGTLAYYRPWGNVVMFYGYFGSGSGLYELGEAILGNELISKLKHVVEITAID